MWFERNLTIRKEDKHRQVAVIEYVRDQTQQVRPEKTTAMDDNRRIPVTVQQVQGSITAIHRATFEFMAAKMFPQRAAVLCIHRNHQHPAQ